MNKALNARKRSALNAEQLREHLDYDSGAGIFTWKPRRWRSAKGEAGCINNKGYLVITINDIQYQAQHLAWLYHYGEWPEKELDHKDTVRSNNRIENLREAEPIQNRANTGPKGSSGIKGVRFKRGKWEASIIYRGDYIYLGSFLTADEAAMAYNNKAAEFHGEFARAA